MRIFLRVAGLVLPGPTTLIAAYLAGIWPVVIAMGILAALAIVAGLAVLAVSINREEKRGSLTYDPSGRGTAFARRLLNVHIRQLPDEERPTAPIEMTREVSR
ncbi:hypothetical protein ACIBG8_46805 [Nonomuraea sp. NPDC050556]|uniref:hypothetical protein n=1 Tax=Nonomuraea sp. NPDC050556 TaxID=3364369 RepID=UPI0037BA93A8